MLGRSIPLLHVARMAGARRVYVDQLGFAVRSEYRADETLPDPAYMVVQRDDAVLHLSSFSGDGVSGHVASILADDVDALHAEFAAKGVAICMPPTDQSWGTRELYVEDADGNSVRFQQLPSRAA
ncbi:MAG: VOC family protein [Alphaproteobacteria bacterium]|nr:VOC family protein [Alphaproteobacteria bacterium]